MTLSSTQKWILLLCGGFAIGAILLRSRSASASSSSSSSSDFDASLDISRVVLFGDSLTTGSSYLSEMQKLLGSDVTVQAFGYKGKGTGYLLGKLPSVLATRPDVVVVLAGVNDLASGRTPDAIAANLSEIYRRIHEAGAAVVAVHLTPWACHSKGQHLVAETDAVNQMIDISEAEAVVPTAELGNAYGCLLSEYGGADGLHLTAAGQRKLAELVYYYGFA